jgi:hypothetical protein
MEGRASDIRPQGRCEMQAHEAEQSLEVVKTAGGQRSRRRDAAVSSGVWPGRASARVAGSSRGAKCVAGKWSSPASASNGQPIEPKRSGHLKRGEPRPVPVAIHRRLSRGVNRRGGSEPRGRNENCGWYRDSEGGQPPGVDARQTNRRRGTQRTNRQEGPVQCRREGRGALPRCDGHRETGEARRRRRPGRSPGRKGRLFNATDKSTRPSGQLEDRPDIPPRASARGGVSTRGLLVGCRSVTPTGCGKQPIEMGRARARLERKKVDAAARKPRQPAERAGIGRPIRASFRRDLDPPGPGPDTSDKFTRGCRARVLVTAQRALRSCRCGKTLGAHRKR